MLWVNRESLHQKNLNQETQKEDLQKVIEKIPLDLFGGKNTSPTNTTKRYINRKPREGQSSSAERTQFTVDIQYEITTE